MSDEYGDIKNINSLDLNKYINYIKNKEGVIWVGGYTTERYLSIDIINEYDYRVRNERERRINEIFGADTISV